jgi:hypothetical protein
MLAIYLGAYETKLWRLHSLPKFDKSTVDQVLVYAVLGSLLHDSFIGSSL